MGPLGLALDPNVVGAGNTAVKPGPADAVKGPNFGQRMAKNMRPDSNQPQKPGAPAQAAEPSFAELLNQMGGGR